MRIVHRLGTKRPQCNPAFMNKIEASDLIWVRPLVDKGHNFNNFTKIGWDNEREGNRKENTRVYGD